jgi:broad specificity polyphosphatase/5'/3'-nucleotidase SurE
MDAVKIKSGYTSISISDGAKKKLRLYCKHQREKQKTVIEYIIGYAVYHDLNVNIPLPKTKQANHVTQQNFTDLQNHLENIFLRSFKTIQVSDPEQEEMIKRLRDRQAQIIKSKDADYNSVVQQWNESILLAKSLRQEIAELKKGSIV